MSARAGTVHICPQSWLSTAWTLRFSLAALRSLPLLQSPASASRGRGRAECWHRCNGALRCCWMRARRTCAALLPRGLQCVGQLRGGVGYCGVRVDDVGQVDARTRLVELLHCGVEAGPELGWPAAAGPGSQLVGRARAFGVGDGPPCQSCAEALGRGRRASRPPRRQVIAVGRESRDRAGPARGRASHRSTTPALR